MKFKYRDEIRVTSGFYQGCTGFIENIDECKMDEYDVYQCELYKSENETFAWLPENILEKIG